MPTSWVPPSASNLWAAPRPVTLWPKIGQVLDPLQSPVEKTESTCGIQSRWGHRFAWFWNRRPIAAPKMPQQALAWSLANRRWCSDWRRWWNNFLAGEFSVGLLSHAHCHPLEHAMSCGIQVLSERLKSVHDKLMRHYSRLASKLLIRKQVWVGST